jgi:hypothetical protein
MKIYIWHDVLCDYSCGMAVAYAENLEEAVDGLEHLLGKWALEDFGPPTKIIDVETDKQAFVTFVRGGG